MTARVGYPATLMYFSHFPFWKTFFQELGLSVISSGITTKRIMDSGVNETVSDACIPIKVSHGHVLALKDKVDYIFLPRMVNTFENFTFCPKFLGLPDMVRHSLHGLPPLIDDRIDLKKGPLELLLTCQRIGRLFGRGLAAVLKAYSYALRAHKDYMSNMQKGYYPWALLEADLTGNMAPTAKRDGTINLAVLGYPYQIYDPFISCNLLSLLHKLGVNVYTTEMLTLNRLRKYKNRLPKNLFWHFSTYVLWSTYYYLDQKAIDGIIHVSAFGCGPDAMLDKLMELASLSAGKPYLCITIDEHTGYAGLQTRLEAFVDMVNYRRD